MTDFKCPKCGSPYFSRDVDIKGEKVIVLKTVCCHGAACGWKGVFPGTDDNPHPFIRFQDELRDAIVSAECNDVDRDIMVAMLVDSAVVCESVDHMDLIDDDLLEITDRAVNWIKQEVKAAIARHANRN